MSDHHHRSVIKGITWRALAMLDTVLLSFLFTGSIGKALSIGVIELFTKTFLYWIHERMWLRIKRGRETKYHPEHGATHEERHWRSLVKAASWRVVGSLDTTLIALVITGNLIVSLAIGGAEMFTKILLYYIHERIWLKLKWGTKRRGT